MKTAMQEMFSKLEIDHPELFNINTQDGRNFVNAYEVYLRIEELQIKTAFENGKYTGVINNQLTSKEYYELEFKTN